MGARRTARAFILGVSIVTACGGDAPSIDTLALPAARVGQAYETRLEASGPTDLAWSLADGRLPPGLALSKLGRILGTPEEAGRFDLVIAARAPTGAADEKALVLEVGEGRPLTLHTTRLPEAVVGIPYGANLDATGGVAPYRWSVTAGALPEGLALAVEREGARLVGEPRAPGRFAFALEVRDDRGASVTRQVTLVVNARRRPIRVVTEALPRGRRGAPYRAEIVSAGGAAETLAWDLVDGALPPGLDLAEAGTPAATVTGTPTRAGTYRFTVGVIEPSGGMASKSFEIDIGSDPIRFGGIELPVAEVGQAYTSTLALAGGTGKATKLSIDTGRLPRGLHLAEESVTGVPRESGRYPIVVRASDDASSATIAVELEVLDVLRIETEALPDAQVGVAYTATVTAAGAAGGVRRFDAEGLPPGLDAEAEGAALRIAGIPRRGGLVEIEASVVDDRGRAALREVPLRVHPRLRVVTRALPPARVGAPYEAQLQARGGQKVEKTWTVVRGRLPYGIALDPRRGASGPPPAPSRCSSTPRVRSPGRRSAPKRRRARRGGRGDPRRRAHPRRRAQERRRAMGAPRARGDPRKRTHPPRRARERRGAMGAPRARGSDPLRRTTRRRATARRRRTRERTRPNRRRRRRAPRSRGARRRARGRLRLTDESPARPRRRRPRRLEGLSLRASCRSARTPDGALRCLTGARGPEAPDPRLRRLDGAAARRDSLPPSRTPRPRAARWLGGSRRRSRPRAR
jgi:hypothetical protein